MKTALFGGTFDPVHAGHLAIAAAAVEACQLDRVIFVPCYQSPHKQGKLATDGAHRLAMLELATAEFPWAEVSTYELDREKPSYSWQTAEHFSNESEELHWILGADQWVALDRWSEPKTLARLLHFIVFPRDNLQLEPREGFRATFLDTRHPASATEIRDNHGTSKDLMHEVVAYIAEQGLYGSE